MKYMQELVPAAPFNMKLALHETTAGYVLKNIWAPLVGTLHVVVPIIDKPHESVTEDD